MFAGKDFTPGKISEVQENSPAEVIGLKKNDVIYKGRKRDSDIY